MNDVTANITDLDSFMKGIVKFNNMYQLPTTLNEWNHSDDFATRPYNFFSIINKKFKECDTIIAAIKNGDPLLYILKEYSNLIGGIVVCCASESLKFGCNIVIPEFSNRFLNNYNLYFCVNSFYDKEIDILNEHLILKTDDMGIFLNKIVDVVFDFAFSRLYNYKKVDPFRILDIIMASNFSKLGEDGKPIYDKHGKVLKGPGYWEPEPAIERYLRSLGIQN